MFPSYLRLALLLFSFQVGACALLVVGDSAIIARGNLGTFAGSDCYLDVKLHDGSAYLNLGLILDESGNIENDFTVSGRRQIYFLAIACNGRVIATKEVVFRSNGKGYMYVDFGELGRGET